MKRNLSNIALVLIVTAVFYMVSTPSFADWDPTNPADVAKAKWIQLPDLSSTGMDVLATLQPNAAVPPGPQWKILADDFLCTQSGPITDVHLWGSWLNDILPQDSQGLSDPGALRFKLSFHSDVPATATSFSHPGAELWSAIFSPGQFKVNPDVIAANEQFYDPNLDAIIGTDHEVYQYNFTSLFDALGNPFVQSQGTIYWLDVQTEVLNVQGVVPAVFGWKTRDPSQHFNDDAVFADTAGFAGALTTVWNELRYPAGHPLQGQSIDLSFVLTVPEPSSLALFGLGAVALAGYVWRRSKRVA